MEGSCGADRASSTCVLIAAIVQPIHVEPGSGTALLIGGGPGFLGSLAPVAAVQVFSVPLARSRPMIVAGALSVNSSRASIQ